MTHFRGRPANNGGGWLALCGVADVTVTTEPRRTECPECRQLVGADDNVVPLKSWAQKVRDGKAAAAGERDP